MARNNKIDPEVLKKVELQILQNLSFNITSNNYARIIITYLEKWEEVSYIKILCFDNHL
jgi:transcriptional regulator NrdR family protein